MILKNGFMKLKSGCLNVLYKKKEGPVIYFSLEDTIRKMCSDTQVKHLNSYGGVERLITKLKSLYAKKHKSKSILCTKAI